MGRWRKLVFASLLAAIVAGQPANASSSERAAKVHEAEAHIERAQAILLGSPGCEDVHAAIGEYTAAIDLLQSVGVGSNQQEWDESKRIRATTSELITQRKKLFNLSYKLC